MNTRKLLINLSKRFPKRIAKQNHDFVGLMVGKLPLEVHKIVICLDLDNQIIDEVIKIKPDIVFTHHPFIYGSKAKVLKYDFDKKALVDKLENAGICVYSMHTNFDTGVGGMNDALSEKLLLKDIYAPEKDPMMRIGFLENEIDIDSFARYAIDKLSIDYGLLIKEGNQTIKKVAIVGGGGSRGWRLAKEENADIYISGDAPHHVRRDIINNKFNYLDLPHEIEKIFMPTLGKILIDLDNELEIIMMNHEKGPKVIN